MTEVRLITLRSAIFREVSQNLVLHAISEESVIGDRGQILEGQDRDTFLRHRVAVGAAEVRFEVVPPC